MTVKTVAVTQVIADEMPKGKNMCAVLDQGAGTDFTEPMF